MKSADACRAHKGTAKSRYCEACLNSTCGCAGALGCPRQLHISMLGTVAAARAWQCTLGSHNVGEAIQDRLEDAVDLWQSQTPPLVWESCPNIDGLQAATLQHGSRCLKLARKEAPADPWRLQSLLVGPGSWQPPAVLHTVCYLVLMGLIKQLLSHSMSNLPALNQCRLHC